MLILIYTGVAWLSSVRVVKCLVNCLNERNPYFFLFKKNIASEILWWKEGWSQVSMTLINWATHVLQR